MTPIRSFALWYSLRGKLASASRLNTGRTGGASPGVPAALMRRHHSFEVLSPLSRRSAGSARHTRCISLGTSYRYSRSEDDYAGSADPVRAPPSTRLCPTRSIPLSVRMSRREHAALPFTPSPGNAKCECARASGSGTPYQDSGGRFLRHPHARWGLNLTVRIRCIGGTCPFLRGHIQRVPEGSRTPRMGPPCAPSGVYIGVGALSYPLDPMAQLIARISHARQYIPHVSGNVYRHRLCREIIQV